MRQDGEELTTSDAALLRRFVRQEKQAAFSELVARYSGLVYSTCLRDVGSVAVAEDATQAVFLLLARKAPTLGTETSLAGWLYRTARLVSRNAARQEARVRLREQRLGLHMAVEAAQRPQNDDPWDRVEPVLHDALDALGHREREALLLRFFDERSFQETGAALGLSEDAARMRVSRSLEKLRRHLAKAGVVLTTALLAGLLTEKAVQAAPAALQKMVLHPAPGPSAPAGPASIPRVHHLAQGAIRTMWINKAIVTGSLIGLSATGCVVGALHVRQAQTILPAQGTPAPSPTASGEPSAQDIISQAATATRALKSLRSDLHWTLSAGGATARVAEHFDVQRPNFARLDTNTFSSGARAEWTVADGSFVWRYSQSTHRLVQKPDAADGRGIGIGSRTVDAFVRFFFDPSLTGLRVEPSVGEPVVRYVGEQTWHGDHYQVIEIKQKAQQFQQVGNTTLAFFGDDHLLHRIYVTTVFTDATESYVDASLSNVKPNAPIAGSQFVLIAPAESTLINAAPPHN